MTRSIFFHLFRSLDDGFYKDFFEIQFHPGFWGCCPPPHVKPPQNLVKSGAKLAFPRWNSVIMNQIGKHNGKLKRKLYHFFNAALKKISPKFSPSIFGRQKCFASQIFMGFFPNFLGRNMVADFRDDIATTKVAVLRPDLALHSGPLGRLVAMLRDQEWKGMGQVGKDMSHVMSFDVFEKTTTSSKYRRDSLFSPRNQQKHAHLLKIFSFPS